VAYPGVVVLCYCNTDVDNNYNIYNWPNSKSEKWGAPNPEFLDLARFRYRPDPEMLDLDQIRKLWIGPD